MAVLYTRYQKVHRAQSILSSPAGKQLLIVARVLKPGAWVQMIEYYHMCQSDNGSITDSNAIRQWSQKYMQSLDSIKDPRAGLRLQSLLSEAGFANVEVEMIRVPLCAWSTSKNYPGLRLAHIKR